MTSTRNLLSYGIRAFRTATFIENTRDPILTMLSIGVEKLYKLTLGLLTLQRDGSWPKAAKMKEWGHSLIPMHRAIMDELRSRTATRSEYLRGLVAQVDTDPVVPALIEALDLYGRMGRFYYLDLLGDDPQPVSPDEAWQKIERIALADPDVSVLYQRAVGQVNDNTAWDVAHRALNERIATSAERVWLMIAVCGRNRALGETGQLFGFEVHPDAVGHQ